MQEANNAPVAESSPAVPEEPKKPSRAEIGRLRRQYITKVHSTVNACGHKFHPINEPRTNCADCWEAFFRVHEGVVSGIQSIIAAFGEAELVKARGKEFLKRYKQFAAQVEEEQRNKATIEIKEN